MRSTETAETLKLSENESTSAERSSAQMPESPENDSVYDFLYHDARRVASFLSQFHKYGSPTGIKAIEEAESTGVTATSGSLAASLPLLGQASGNLGHNTQKREADKLEQTFDPFWTGARKFLDYLQSADLLVREAETARIGQFVLVTGRLAVFDMKVMHTVWGNKVLRDMALDVLVKGVDVTPGHHPKKHRDIVTALFEFVRELPHVVQMGIKTPLNFFWGALAEENMVTSPIDMLLKNGGSLSGDWTVLAILDAFPNDQGVVDNSAMESLGTFGGIAAFFAPHIRKAVGRPEDAYGITPVLIFREVSGNLVTP